MLPAFLFVLTEVAIYPYMTKKEHPLPLFPPNFLFGTATASYQIEGAAREDGRGCSIWDTFSRTPGKVFQGHNGDIACDHYHRYPEDIAIMKELGMGAYRFSAAWPRIYPNGYGKVNPAGLDFYDRLTDALLEAGIHPCLTLYHWDLPQLLEDEGGWTVRTTAEHFVNYADTLLARIGDRMHSVATLNEPWCSATLGYLSGEHAPGKRNLRMFLSAVHHLLLGHGMAQEVIRNRAPKALSGITLNLQQFYPNDPDKKEDRRVAELSGELNNGIYMDALFKGEYPQKISELLREFLPKIEAQDLKIIRQPIDFLGLNYYFPVWLAEDTNLPGIKETFSDSGTFPADTNPLAVITRARVCERNHLPHTAMHWPVYPDGLRDLLIRTAKDYDVKRMFVTEMAVLGMTNFRVIRWWIPNARITCFLICGPCRQAIDAGVPLEGYYCWSLLDNFEWAQGYSKRFGIIYCDYEKEQRRVWKDSAFAYRRVIQRQSESGVGEGS